MSDRCCGSSPAGCAESFADDLGFVESVAGNPFWELYDSRGSLICRLCNNDNSEL